MRILFALLLIAIPARSFGQTVVEFDLASAEKLLENHGFSKGASFLARLANNYKRYDNIRVRSTWYEESIGALAKAIRTDFDGAGKEYIPDHTIWAVSALSGNRVLLAASMLDSKAILMSTDIDYLKGMIAFEILESIRRGNITIRKASKKALDVGIEMQVTEDFEGKKSISFFGHQGDQDQIVGKLIVIDPPDLVWK